MSVFIALSDGRGRTPLTLRLVSADEDVTIVSADAEIDFDDPRAVVELSVELKNIGIPRAGEYRLQLLCEDEPLMERRIIATYLKAGSNDASD